MPNESRAAETCPDDSRMINQRMRTKSGISYRHLANVSAGQSAPFTARSRPAQVAPLQFAKAGALLLVAGISSIPFAFVRHSLVEFVRQPQITVHDSPVSALVSGIAAVASAVLAERSTPENSPSTESTNSCADTHRHGAPSISAAPCCPLYGHWHVRKPFRETAANGHGRDPAWVKERVARSRPARKVRA